MKTRVIIIVSILLITVSYQSCKEKDVNLLVDITSVGYNNTHIGYLGGTLGVSADVIAEKKIDKIEIGISKETGNLKLEKSAGSILLAWEFDSVYTDKYSGELNASFNEEIFIPLTVDIGAYQLTFSVMDEDGNKTTVQENFSLDYGK
jgi:hypothetical protein